MPDLVPTADHLPTIVLPPALDGRDGSNRARGGVRQIAADTDIEAVRMWLAEYAESPHTLRSYGCVRQVVQIHFQYEGQTHYAAARSRSRRCS